MTRIKRSLQLTFRKKIAFEVFRRHKKHISEIHPLTTLFWECTLRCNLQCMHCGSDCKQISSVNDMPFADFTRALDSISNHMHPSNVFICITGGEPLVRSDLEECGMEISQRGFAWGMVTNGLALTRQRFESLQKAGLKTISISLDGFEQAHTALRGNTQSFSKAVEAIKIVQTAPHITFDVITCVSPLNINEIHDLADFLIDLGVRRWRINTIFPVGRGSENTCLHLSNAQFLQLFETIEHIRKTKPIDLSYSCEGFLGNFEGAVRDSFFFCRAGINYASVLIDGSISACTNIRSKFIQGSIYSHDFMQVWNTQFELYRNRKWTHKGQCAECDMYSYCEGNGIHLYDDNSNLQVCHYKKLL